MKIDETEKKIKTKKDKKTKNNDHNWIFSPLFFYQNIIILLSGRIKNQL
jgi:hypothetical protein